MPFLLYWNFYYYRISLSPRSLLFKPHFVSSEWCLHPCQISSCYSYMHLCLSLVLPSIDLHVYFCTNNILFIVLCSCTILWNLVWYSLQHCSFCSVLLWVSELCCGSKWILGFFLFLWRMPWRFSMWVHRICKFILLDDHLHNWNFIQLWSSEIFPFSASSSIFSFRDLKFSL